jgi:hypothetical protein
MPKDSEEKAVWQNISVFLPTAWNNSVCKPLKELVAQFDKPTYAGHLLVRTLFSYAGVANKPIHPKKALWIADTTMSEFSGHTQSRQASCKTILSGLEQFFSIYKNEGERSKKIIKDAFQQFLGIDPDSLDIARFEQLKREVFDYHNITELLKPDEYSAEGNYLLVPKMRGPST